MEFLYWSTFFLILYAFIGYPLLLRFLPQRRHISLPLPSQLPRVSVIVSVYNEERVIADKIRNFLEIDYPKQLFELVVVSDRCTDRTEEITASFDNPHIKLLRQPVRQGKTAALNRAMQEATGEILIFTDANSIIDREAVHRLVRHFSDPRVGLVTGRTVNIGTESESGAGGGFYRHYEDFIRKGEDRVGSVVGADGALYAMRASLYRPLPPRLINDLLHTGQVVLEGYLAVSEPEAICREPVEEHADEQFQRQVRIAAQSWLIYFCQAGELLVRRKLLYLWQFTSHKVLRWTSVPLMGFLYLLSLPLVTHDGIYPYLFLLQTLFFLSALAERWIEGGVTRYAYLFFMVHLAAMAGFYRYLCGNVYITWQPRNN